MDIFSHGLWAGAIAKGINNKNKKKTARGSGARLSYWRTFFWGVFPDLFAFTIPFVALLWSLIAGGATLTQFRGPEDGGPAADTDSGLLGLAYHLYNFSHSIVIFLMVIGLIYIAHRFIAPSRLKLKRVPWEMLGWPLHILMDIPTHTYKFFPTPFLYPLFGIKLNGYAWAHPLFLLIDWAALLAVYLYLWRDSLRKRKIKKVRV